MAVAEVDPLVPAKLRKHFAAEAAKVAGYDHVVIRNLAVLLPQVCRKRVRSSRGHRSPHIVCIRDAKIHHTANGAARHEYVAELRPTRVSGLHKQARSCPCHRALRRRRRLPAHFQRIAVLPLRRAEMACGCAGNMAGITAIDEHAAKQQRFRHRGTCAIQPQKRDRQFARGKVCRNDLVQKIAAQEQVDFRRLHGAAFKRTTHDLFKHLALRLFPAVLPPGIVFEDQIKIPAERPRSLHITHDGCACCDARRRFKHHGLSA